MDQLDPDRVIQGFESVDARLVEVCERLDRVEVDMASTIDATRSAQAAILRELGRLNQIVAELVTNAEIEAELTANRRAKRSGKKDDTDNKKDGEQEDETLENDDANPPVTPTEPAPSKRRMRFL